MKDDENVSGLPERREENRVICQITWITGGRGELPAVERGVYSADETQSGFINGGAAT